MVHIREVIVVEGKYDAIRLHSVTDAVIVQTDGFRIFRDKERLCMLRRLAETRGLLVLTDSDSAGMLIRNHLIGAIPKERIRQAYIPPVEGKERRKAHPSAEGLLGVEGMDGDILERVLRQAATVTDRPRTAAVDKARLYADGLSGSAGSADKRRRLLRSLGLPDTLSANRLMDYLNAAMTVEDYEKAVAAL